MKITSYGATRAVTGSKHVLEVNGKKILLDCGMFQGHRVEAAARNRDFGFDPTEIDAAILSHAHIDHSGLFPMLVKHGYSGPIYCTPATRDLCSVMLLDSAHIQQRDAAWLSKKNMTFVPPLYDPDDVQEAMRKMVSIPYEMRMPVIPGVYFTFHDAGHVLGSAMVELEIEQDGHWRTLLFSGDIGRKQMPILKDPWEPKPADIVLMEGTYGDRDHHPIQEVEKRLARVIQEAHERGGKIIIPSFALERAQEVIYVLKRLELNNAIPDIPVFVDSPLTCNVTHIFRLHTESFDQNFSKLMQEAGDPFQLRRIRYIRSLEESMELNTMKGPAIIIAAAGMCEHGRVVHHIKNHCSDPKNTILIVGFQAKNTLGRRIVERRRVIRVLGVERELNARVEIMNEFSAHAGQKELIRFAMHFKDCAEKILLVHGEEEALLTLRNELHSRGLTQVEVQDFRVPVEL
ncbi:MAG: MBL fold metallo-hydrolase [Candidatus Hydrogenedens sp.]|nr:MBL fold metallo-hydrolase [Candidatus Hydrogenedens sp.]